MKLKNTQPQSNIVTTNQIKFDGIIPDCALSGDCHKDESNLTYLIAILLQRYCDSKKIIDADLSSIDITCLIESNMDIEIPENITIETLSTFYKNHFCALYEKISDIHSILDTLVGIHCFNDIAQVDQNGTVEIDVILNDILYEVSGVPIVSIDTAPINGTAYVNSNKITYTANSSFFGNDQLIYKVNKGAYQCTAKVSIKVNKIITTQTITDIVIDQMITILQSDEYWDIGLPIGTKIAITETQLSNFNLLGGSWGKGSGKFAKWAIANGNNNTDNYAGLTTRGFDVNDSNYNNTSYNNSNGSDSVTLVKNNIPPHRHKYFDAFMNAIDGGGEIFSANVDAHSTSEGVAQGTIYNSTIQISEGNDEDRDAVWYDRNTGDGTDNINDQDELLSSPTAVNIKNKYFTEIMIQKIL